MDLLITITSFILLISLIVGIHELGHFLAARKFGIHVLNFKIGFGKELFATKDKNDCKFSIGILPLGGYVQMLGENIGTEGLSRKDYKDKKTYFDATLNERAIVTAAGPFANFVLAIFIYFCISLIGTTQLGSYIGDVSQGSLAEEAGISSQDRVVSIDGENLEIFSDINLKLSKRIGDTGTLSIGFIKEGSNFITLSKVYIEDWLSSSRQNNPSLSFGVEPLIPALIGGIKEDGPADKAGILVNDLVTSINNKNVDTWQQLSREIKKLPGKEITVSLIRENRNLLISLRTESLKDKEGFMYGRIGVMASNKTNDWPEHLLVTKEESVLGAVKHGFTETYKFTSLIVDSIGKMISGSVSADNIGGPIQISVLAGSAAKAGLLSFLSMIAILSINLGLLNLLPIPLLDGGQLLIIAIEKLKGSPVSDKFLEYSLRMGVLLVAGIMIFAFVNDIVRLI